MKTQIISLAAHDDLISVRDRMSWAKTPRILLVWPSREQVGLQPLEMRILQQHARELGADLGLVARDGGIRRDAQAFGIPVFRTTIEAERQKWPTRGRRGRRRPVAVRARLDRLREMRARARPHADTWTSGVGVRIGAFALAVLSVLSLVLLFVPRAEVVLRPETREQTLTLTVDVRTGEGAALEQGGVPAQRASTQASGTQTVPVAARSEVAITKAAGIARIQNISAASIVIPAGTVIYSLEPALMRFVTLQDVELDTGANNIVGVPIEAMQPGAAGNLPPDSLAGVEGSLSASVVVTNPEPIAGGSNDQQSVPAQAERDQLRADLQHRLQIEAQAAIESLLEEGDLLLPGTISLTTMDREVFDPPPGMAASVLSLSLTATYEGQYIRGADLRALSQVALDAQLPSGYLPDRDTLRMQINQIAVAEDSGRMQLELDLRRVLNRSMDLARASELVRGARPDEAKVLLGKVLPLAADPEIRLTPPWWPRLPLIPFRIQVTVQ